MAENQRFVENSWIILTSKIEDFLNMFIENNER